MTRVLCGTVGVEALEVDDETWAVVRDEVTLGDGVKVLGISVLGNEDAEGLLAITSFIITPSVMTITKFITFYYYQIIILLWR